jgi:hypothetical protein
LDGVRSRKDFFRISRGNLDTKSQKRSDDKHIPDLIVHQQTKLSLSSIFNPAVLPPLVLLDFQHLYDMLKKSSAYGSSGGAHSPHIAEDNENVKKQKIITWDEVTIAEHDKERGTRYTFSTLL